MRRRDVLALAAAWTAAGCAADSRGRPPGPRATPPTPRDTPPASSRTAESTPESAKQTVGSVAEEVAHGPRDRPLIALTFHGAGSPRLADRMLRAFDRHRAHATILAVGTWLDQYPAVARRILDAGHDLGNHTQRHLAIATMHAAAARAEIDDCAARLRALTGSPGSWFRPSATPHATALIRRLAARAGYPTCLSYDVDSLDYTDPGPAAIITTVLRAVRPGSIVSLHLGHPGTADALPDLLTALRAKGLRPVNATQLLTR
ncbi:polysaccharide deacetylase family protein [Streptosporangiaceae bacterium NEAU-GS5]|nr:polysaccharide deacetylase family protein [Streptosporangiaceae bacterium NEAU-GS5]